MIFVLTGDMHLREDTPMCRTDDYQEAQKRKLDFIKDLVIEHNAIRIDSGDIFNHWKPSPYLSTQAIMHFKSFTSVSVAGNHDMPQHNSDLLMRSGFGLLEAIGVINNFDRIDNVLEASIYRCPYEFEVPKVEDKSKFNVLVIHHLVYQGKAPYPGAEKTGNTAKAMLEKYKDFDLIVSGHNHQTIVEGLKERVLINPGSMMRMTSAQIDHNPSVFVFDTDNRSIKQMFLPIEEGVISREHIEQKDEKESRVNAFLSRLNNDVELKLSFKDNLEKYMNENLVRDSVQKMVWEVLK